MLQSLDSGPIVSTDDWTMVSDRRTAPAATGFIRIRLIATRAGASATTNDAYFDQVVLRPQGWLGLSLTGIGWLVAISSSPGLTSAVLPHSPPLPLPCYNCGSTDFSMVEVGPAQSQRFTNGGS